MPMRNPKLRWLLRAGFAVALVLTVVFTVRTISSALYWSDPDHVDQLLEPWMPLGYVARSWDVPREVLAEALNLPIGEQPRRNLELIAEDIGISFEDLSQRTERAIEAYRGRQHD